MRILIYILFAINLLSCSSEKSKNRQLIKALSVNDVKLDAPKPSDWLYEHNEKGQTFDEYLFSSPIRPNDSRYVIYLQPIGQFDSLQSVQLKSTHEYLKAFFGLEVAVLDPLANDLVPDSARRIGAHGDEQFLASYILYELLKQRLPKDAIGMMAITATDLYPKPSWNYVFGLSSLKNRVSVTSMYRFEDDDSAKSLNRLLKVSTHEIVHMLSMKHCINALCLMNGSNHLAETDRKPNHLCSECTGKLMWNLNKSPMERLNELSNFFKKHGFEVENERLLKDIEVLKK
ncbi:MAG: archaemetzincin [Bacteroidia bacterium]